MYGYFVFALTRNLKLITPDCPLLKSEVHYRAALCFGLLFPGYNIMYTGRGNEYYPCITDKRNRVPKGWPEYLGQRPVAAQVEPDSCNPLLEKWPFQKVKKSLHSRQNRKQY